MLIGTGTSFIPFIRTSSSKIEIGSSLNSLSSILATMKAKPLKRKCQLMLRKKTKIQLRLTLTQEMTALRKACRILDKNLHSAYLKGVVVSGTLFFQYYKQILIQIYLYTAVTLLTLLLK